LTLSRQKNNAGTEDGKKMWQRLVRLVWHALVVFIACFAAWKFIDFSQLIASLQKVSLLTIFTVILLVTADRMLMAYKWLALLKIVNVIPKFRKILSIYYQAAFISRIMPTALAGDILRGYLIANFSHGWEKIVGSMFIEKIMAVLSSIGLAIVGSLFLLQQLQGEGIPYFPYLLIAAIISMLILFQLSFTDWLQDLLIRWVPMKKVQPFLLKFRGAYLQFKHHRTALAINFTMALFENGLQVLIIYVCALGIDTDASAVRLVSALAISQFLRKIAMIVEGWVLGEMIVVLTCSLAAIDQTQALTFSLVSYAIRFLAISPGGVLLLLNRRSGILNKKDINRLAG
jgi:uncharacterized membrane protein YbhN (UPF0104 family)